MNNFTWYQAVVWAHTTSGPREELITSTPISEEKCTGCGQPLNQNVELVGLSSRSKEKDPTRDRLLMASV